MEFLPDINQPRNNYDNYERILSELYLALENLEKQLESDLNKSEDIKTEKLITSISIILEKIKKLATNLSVNSKS